METWQVFWGIVLVGILLVCCLIWPRVWGIRSNEDTTEPELRVASLHDAGLSEIELRDLLERYT